MGVVSASFIVLTITTVMCVPTSDMTHSVVNSDV